MERRWRPGTDGPDAAGASGPEEDWREKWGRGQRNPVTGDYEWYEIPEAEKESSSGEALTWGQLLGRWDLIVPDLLSEYGVDAGDRALLKARRWSWLEALIVGLLDKTTTRLSRHIAKERQQDTPPPADEDEEAAAWH